MVWFWSYLLRNNELQENEGLKTKKAPKMGLNRLSGAGKPPDGLDFASGGGYSEAGAAVQAGDFAPCPKRPGISAWAAFSGGTPANPRLTPGPPRKPDRQRAFELLAASRNGAIEAQMHAGHGEDTRSAPRGTVDGGVGMNDFDDFGNIFENLPADPEQAFLLLEAKFRAECEERVRKAHQDENLNAFYVDYIAQVIAAITELGLATEFASHVPQIQDVDYNTYLNFSKALPHDA
jgi:hypothetical protein